MVVSLPDYDPNKIKAPYAYVIKIENFGKFARKPVINISLRKESFNKIISFAKEANQEIRYTLDGSEPNIHSDLYVTPIMLKKSTTVKAISIFPGALPSEAITKDVQIYEWKSSEKPKSIKSGIAWKYYEPEGTISLASIQNSDVKIEGISEVISEKVKQREEKYALQFDGYIKVKENAVYHFSTLSDDGSKLFIDDQEVVNNDGQHGSTEQSGAAALKKGYHKIRVTYFDAGGGNELKVFWWQNENSKKIIPSEALFH